MSLPIERLESLSVLPGAVVVIVDADFTMVAVSSSITQTLGYTPEEFTGTNGLPFVHPEDRDLVADTWSAFGDEPDRSIRYEIRVAHKSGEWRWVEVIARNLLHDPSVGSYLLNFRDVTERREAQDALVASEERFRALVQNTSDVVLILNEDLTISYASPSLATNLEIDPQEILAKSALDFVHPDDHEHVAYALLPVFKEAGTANACFRTPRANGEWHEVEATCVNLLDDPHVRGIVCNIRDVSETRAAQEALAASERRMRALVQHSDNIVVILDRDGVITWASPASEHIVGWNADELVGRTAASFEHPDDVEAAVEPFLTTREGPLGASASVRGRVRCRDGTWKWLECVFTNRFDDPAIGGIIGNFRDISGQVEAEQSLRDSERLFRSLAESSPSGIYRQDNDNNCVFVNDRWLEITGLTFEEALGQGWHRVVHPDDAPNMRGTDGTIPDPTRPPQFSEFRVVRPDGTVRWVVARSAPMYDEEGQIAGRVGTIADITDRMDARRDTQRLTDIFEATHDLVGITDGRGRLLYVNQSARAFFGLPSEGALAGANLLRHFTRPGARRLLEEIRPALVRDGMWYGEVTLVRADGEEIPMLAQLLRHDDAEGNFEFFSGVMHDISQRKEFESQLAHQATHDPLTSLPNRVLLLERLQFALERARRTHKRVAVLFLDLDHFKVVNDSLGHGVGDILLMSIAERLKTVVRPGDTIARFGGDEFVVLCEDLVTRADAIAVADRVNDVISGPFTVGDAEVFVGVSIGIAFPDDPDAEAGTLIRDADAAMYRAKERGRARWEVFDNAMRASAVDRLDIENALRRAQERRELRVFYQPIISLATGGIVGVEALIRWEHPERGLLLPNEFIHVAEETGLIVPMGAWVLEQSCRQLMRWQASLPNLAPLRLSVNLSSRQLGHATLVPNVRAIIADTHIDPNQVELEITESVLMDDVEMSEETLGQLKRLGVKLVVDDFGTGYSSLSYLRRFPVDVLKVDQSFVSGLGDDPSDSAIVTAIVTLAHTLGLSAVAEGIETPDQLAELRRLRCDYGQGFLMARPTPAHDIGELLARRPTW